MTKKEIYYEYLKSDKWKRIRDFVRERDGNKCVECGCRKRLECHHLTYDHLYNEEYYMEELETLCRDCHQQKEDRKKYRSKNEALLAKIERVCGGK